MSSRTVEGLLEYDYDLGSYILMEDGQQLTLHDLVGRDSPTTKTGPRIRVTIEEVTHAP